MKTTITLDCQFQIFRGPGGIKLELNAAEIFPNDPGQGTPALLTLPNGETGTFNAIYHTGETADGTELSQNQNRWLEEISEQVAAWEDYHFARRS